MKLKKGRKKSNTNKFHVKHKKKAKRECKNKLVNGPVVQERDIEQELANLLASGILRILRDLTRPCGFSTSLTPPTELVRVFVK